MSKFKELVRKAGRQAPEAPIADTSNFFLPEIQRRRIRKRRRWFLIVALTVLVLAATGGAVLVVHSRLFQVREVQITGNHEIPAQEILVFLRGQVLDDVWWRNLLGFQNILVWPGSLSASALANFPALKSVTIERDVWQGQVKVVVEERAVYGVWCLNKNDLPRCFWFDDGGTILARAPFTEGNLIRRVDDLSQDQLGLNSKILPAEELENAFSIFRVLNASRFSVKDIRLEDLSLAELHVLTSDGPDLYFSLRFPADNALKVLESFNSKATGFAGIKYFDFRVENRAYYQ